MSIHPTEIKLHQTSRMLEVAFEDGARFQLPCGYLRVFSPSAEVRGHGPGTATLVTGKEQVTIEGINDIKPRQSLEVKITREDGTTFTANTVVRIDTENELDYYRNGGILHYVLRNLARGAA